MPVLIAKLNSNPAKWLTSIQDAMNAMAKSGDKMEVHLPLDVNNISFKHAVWVFAWFFRTDKDCYRQVPLSWRVVKRASLALPSENEIFFLQK